MHFLLKWVVCKKNLWCSTGVTNPEVNQWPFPAPRLLMGQTGSGVTYIVALEVEVSEVDGDAVLGRGNYLPHTVLVGRVEVGVRWTLDGTVCRVDVTPTGIWSKTTTRPLCNTLSTSCIYPCLCAPRGYALVVLLQLRVGIYKWDRQMSHTYPYTL